MWTKIGTAPYVLIGAHYDHLGTERGDNAYWGADDNAAAVAILLELAARLQRTPPDIGVIMAAFDGEEPPHFLTDEMGSVEFCKHPPIALDQICLAIIMDLVGHAIGPETAHSQLANSLFVLGAEKTRGVTEAVRSVSANVGGVTPRLLDIDLFPPLSDYEPLRRKGVPVVYLTCGRWRHYHRITDTPERLDYAKMAATADYVQAIIAACPGPIRGRYDPQTRAAASTIASLRAVAPLVPMDTTERSQTLATLEQLSAKPTLSTEDWQTLSSLVAAIEHAVR